MQCYLTDGRGLDTLRLADRPVPVDLADHEVLVRVQAVSLNYRDLLVADGRYGGPQDPPIIAGSDLAGVVAAVGRHVTSLKPGDRVVNAPFRCWPAGSLRRDWAATFVGGQGVDGVLAQSVVYPAAALGICPPKLTPSEAATLPVAALTAWAAVVTHGRTRPGEWVLVHGTGGVSLFAAQFARLAGARVALSSAHSSKADWARQELGIEHTFDYRDADWPRDLRRATGGGVDVVVEVAGGPSLHQSLQACRYGSRVAVIGVLAGTESQINVFDLIRHQISMRGIYMESTEEFHSMLSALASSQIRPTVDRVFPWSDVPAAYRYLQSQQHIGKVVVDVESGHIN